MKGIFTELDGGRLLLTLSKEIYEKDAVIAAGYKFTDLCTVLIRPSERGEIEVVIESKAELATEDLEKVASK